MKFNSEKSP